MSLSKIYSKEYLFYIMNENALTTNVLSVEEIFETEEYVLVKFTEASKSKITVSFEKGIKDADGDIVRFIKI